MAAASFVNPFTEQFAFATSLDARRKLVASELVAGTTDHYIYNALVDLQLLQECHDARVATGTSTVDPTPEEQTALKSLRSLLETPPTSFRPYAPGWEEISRKFHLFNYAYDPQSTLEYLKKELGLSFDHFPAPVDDEEHDLSVSSSILDPALIDTATLLRNQIPLLAQESTYNSTIEEFEESLVLRHLWPATATMDSVSLRSYMDSLLRDRPHPRLSNLTARLHDAIVKFSRTEVPTATELPGHSLITAQILKNLPLSHLLELRTLLPVITENSDYVLAVLRKLAPRIDACLMQRYDTSSLLKDRESGALDQAEQERFLRMALEFVETLSQTYLDLRFTILHAWLKFGMERNVWHEEEFLRYVRIPKHTSWYSVTVLPTNIIPSDYVTFGRTFDVPFIRPVSSAADQILMTEFLTHHFLQYRSYEAFVGILDLEAYLKPLFARTMIMARIGNAADWYPLLGATGIQALSTNSELAFTPQSAHANLRFAPKDLVKLNLRLKNIRTLTIREFRVDTLAYYRQTQKEFDETIDLDGLTPARERVVEYGDKPSVERHEEAFEFGEVVEEEANVHVKVEGDVYQGLKGRGVWVVDFVGGRQNCRAVVRKGTLRYLVKDTVAGHLFTILDEAHRRVTKDCSIWIASKSYLVGTIASYASGDILLPYTTRENINEVILLTHSGFTALRHFHHKQERYGLGAGFYVNPEAIMKDKKAQIVVHPHLTINNQPAPLAILEAKSVQLTIESEDSDGVSSTRVIDEFVINEGECGLAEFRIPDKRGFTS
ncbi:hypothetical protein BC938DRAFT_473603 [Jimgerdemannia flammicorona]|uniref:Uncharacterized protein n=1 Tax=Jimgerdemannia flammicorona TaxID=994334 RepID=A0A433Q3M6_9FUNG|nr:hypothetical protein BC938DRAFT_473603 [Jimgerdemannia flammicorona]